MAEFIAQEPVADPQPKEDGAECTGVSSSDGITPSVSESVQPAPPSQPAPPTVNPFGQHDPNEPKLPQCFDSIAHTLPPQVRAKLKTVDVSTAQVVIQTPNGRKSEPQPLTWFVDDFAQEAAELVGRYGLLRVTVYEPNKQAWFFGVKVPAPDGVESNSREDWREAVQQLAENQQRFMESVKMELMLAGGRLPQQGGGGGGSTFSEELAKTRELIACIREMNAGNDPSQLIATTMDSVGKVFDGVGQIRAKAEEFAGSSAAEPDAVEQFERLTKIPVVEKGIERVFSKALASRTSDAKAGNPAPPKVDPFAGIRQGVA